MSAPVVAENTPQTARDVERVLARLDALRPELEFGRETHVQWRDCDQKWRDMNPSIGDAAFHARCVKEYDERLGAIAEAAALIRKLAQEASR